MWLCNFLLWNHWHTNQTIDEALLSIFHNHTTEVNISYQSKQQQLVVVTIIDIWLDDIQTKGEKNIPDIDGTLYTSLLDSVVSKLVASIESMYNRKTTIIIRRMMYLVYRIFALASQYVVNCIKETSFAATTSTSSPAYTNNMMVWKQSNSLVKLFQIHMDQIRYKNSNTSETTRKRSLMKQRKRDCIFVVLEDWIRVHQFCHEQYCIDKDRYQQWAFIWCQRLTAHHCPMRFGSLTQSLSLPTFSSTTTIGLSHLIDIVTAVPVERVKQQPHQIVNSNQHIQSVDQFHIKRCIVRGFVAFLGQRISNDKKPFLFRNDMITILNWIFCEVLTDLSFRKQDELLVATSMYDLL
jgi:hypothetical protein